MIQKKSRFAGAFASVGDALDETLGVLDALRSGRLSRSDFEEWYEHRRAMITEPISRVFERGREMVAGASPLGYGRSGPTRPRWAATRRRARRTGIRAAGSIRSGGSRASGSVKAGGRGAGARVHVRAGTGRKRR